MKKRALIIDDEAKSRLTTLSFLTKYCPSMEVVGEADGVASGLEDRNGKVETRRFVKGR